jgi:hypothetical protein
MGDPITVATVHGVTVSYDAERKQFMARVGGKEIKKASQREVEKIVSKFARGGERTKAIILEYGWRSVQVLPIEVVGLRGRKVQYKSGMYMESEDADRTFVHDYKILLEAQALKAEHDAWLKKWEALLDKAKQIDPESLK